VPVPSRENKRPFICVLGVSMILSFSSCFYDFPKIRQDKFYLKTACQNNKYSTISSELLTDMDDFLLYFGTVFTMWNYLFSISFSCNTLVFLLCFTFIICFFKTQTCVNLTHNNDVYPLNTIIIWCWTDF
jgi:hypothetical protein